ncbi:hypothetical protein HYPSUDRAFT_32488 [Hypholoma sublateritium FD-334 SS-4]|uniref:Uncharacterized protein n=1 Tax=Hypholoma sublateritium (strain FD-334 SS-4) TaxID=945553 RepID=A0A0D2MYF9_HYPSF|nr:hypothetical protein HYPSUDRAFT_32488 [Hypholoma sublateritium FD-334 SS-4]
MLHTTWRRVSLLPDSVLNPSPLRQFIHNSRCVSGVSVTHFDSGGATALRNGDAERQPTIRCDSLVSDIFVPKNQKKFKASSSKTSSSGETKSAKTMTPAKVYTANESAVPKTKPKKPRFVNPPPPKIEAFLRQLESEVDTLTLADVENYRPSEIADTRSPEYEVQYDAAFDRLTRSFDMPSMRRIFDLYSIPQLSASLQKKKLYSQAILEYWGWKPASMVKEDMLDETKSSELSFSLNNDEAFLLMGKDGAELLNLAQRYGVHLSFSTDRALFLKAKGFQGSLKRLKGYLNSFKTDIQVENASLHLGQILPFETLKRISRLSGAYIMTEDDRVHTSLLFMCIVFSPVPASYFFSQKSTPQP